jgi:hypothetical protein
VQILGDATSLAKALGKGEAAATGFGAGINRAGSKAAAALKNVGKIATVAIGVGVVAAVKKSVEAFAESERVTAQTTAVLKSTGGVANVTAKAVTDLATAVSLKTGIDDEAVQAQENLLLTFTKVRDEAGRGNDVFTQATRTVTDLATSMNHGAIPSLEQMHASSIRIGKALNDPVKGLTALTKVGVTFTEGQKKQVAALVASGDRLGAQKLILKELRTEFGGAAEAAGNTFSGKIAKAKVAVGNLGEAIGAKLVPIIGEGANALAGLVNKLTTSDRPAKFFGAVSHGAGAAKDAISGLVKSFTDKRSGGASIATAIGGTISDAVSRIDWAAIGDRISGGFSAALDFSGKLAPAVTQGITAAFGKVDGGAVIGGLLTGISDALSTALSPSFWIKHIGDAFNIVTVVIPLGKILKIPGFGWLYSKISGPFFNVVKSAITGTASAIGGVVKKVAVEAFGKFAAGIISEAPSAAGAALRLTLKATHALEALPGRLKSLGSRAGGGLVGGLVSAGGKVGSAGAQLIAGAIKAVAAGTGPMRAAAAHVISGGVAEIKAGVGNFVAAGGDLIRGLASGIAGAVGSALSAIANVAKSVIGKAKSLLKVKSPSKVFHEIGLAIPQGMADGINAGAHRVRAALTRGLLFPTEDAIAALGKQSDALQAAFDAADRKGERHGLVHDLGAARKKKEGIGDAIKALKDFDTQTKRSEQLAAINVKVTGLEQIRAFKGAVSDLRSEIADKLNEAVDKFRSNWEATTGKAIDAANAATLKSFDETTDAIVAQTAAARELADLRARDDQDAKDKEDAANAKTLADAQFLVAHSGGKVHADALVQLADAEAQIEATKRKRHEDELEAQVASETATIQEQRAAERAALEDQMAVDRQARMDADVAAFTTAEQAKLDVLTASLEAQLTSYKSYVEAVNAELAKIGVGGIDPNSDQESVFTAGTMVPARAPAKKKPPKKKHAAGGWTGLVLNELGPERLYANRAGGVMVQQASEVARGGGGGDIIQHFHGPIGSTRQARVMANQLAFRLRFG